MNINVRAKMLAIAAGIMVMSAGAASAATLKVDDDRRQCRDAQYRSINAAVLKAMPGDTIEVCPGYYPESVQVVKTLRLVASHGQGKDDRCNRLSNPNRPADPNRDAIVDPPDATAPPAIPGFEVAADNVVIAGFVIQGAFNSPGIDLAPGFSGHRIEDNVIRLNHYGIDLSSSGNSSNSGAQTTRIEKNCFFFNNQASAAGGQGGDGIYSDQGASNVLIEKNLFVGHSDNGIIFVGDAGTQSNIRIEKNELFNNDDGIVLIRVVDSRVEKNNVQQSFGDGIALFDSDNNVLEKNQSENNGLSGIYVNASSTGNRIEKNELHRNGRFDAEDDSMGPGTAGTANFWIKNDCETENRPGLCHHEDGDDDEKDKGKGKAKGKKHRDHDDKPGKHKS